MNSYSRPGSDDPCRHEFQNYILGGLLKKDRSRNWEALTPAWIRRVWEQNEWIQATYSDEDSFTAYCYKVINGKRPFPWPEHYSQQQRLEATGELIMDTVQWVMQNDSQRVAVVFGHTQGLAEGKPFTILGFVKESLKLSGSSGKVSQIISDAMADNKLDVFEADEIINSCNEAIHKYQQIIQTVKNHMKEKGSHE